MQLTASNICTLICLILVTIATGQNVDKAQQAADIQLLKKNNLPTDSDGLKSFLLKHIPTAKADLEVKILIADLGSSSFRVREKTAKKLIDLGPVALRQLRIAANGKDLESKTRAKDCVTAIEQTLKPEVHEAVVRVLVNREKANAAKALFDYLPFAISESVQETVESSLAHSSLSDIKQDPQVLKYLNDRDSARRSMAALLLGRSADPAVRKQVHSLLKDAMPQVRLRAAHGLLLAKDTVGMPQLLDIIESGPFDLAERAETILQTLANDNGPSQPIGKDEQTRKDCRKAWEKWWKSSPKKLAWAELKSTLPGAMPGGRVAQTAQRFLFALARGNVSRFEQMLDVPFVIHPQVTIKDRDQLLQMFRQAASTSPQVQFKVKAGRTMVMSAYMKQAPKSHRKVLAKFPGDTYVYLIQIHDKSRKKQESAVMLLSQRSGGLRIVGILPEK